MSIPVDIGILIVTPVLRSFFGWASKALEDDEVTTYEWKLLLSTILRVGLLGALAYFGFSIAGIDNAALAAGVAAFFADKLFSALKKNKNVK